MGNSRFLSSANPAGCGRQVLALLSGGAVLLVAGTILAGTPEGEGGPGPRALPPLCGTWHRGAGGTDPLDLDGIERAYRDLKAKFDRGVRYAPEDPGSILARPHETGFPACWGSELRKEAPKEALPQGLAGRLLYFASLTDPAAFHAPREVLEAEGAVVLLLGAKRTGDLAKLAERIGRPVHLATGELARSLGVRCSGTLVRISRKGDALEIHEGP